jgi:hypothetical protein
MTSRSAWGLATLAIVPAAFAAFVGATSVVVTALAVVGLLLVVSRVGRQLYGERTDARPPRVFESVVNTRPADRIKTPRDLDRLETLVAARSRTAGGVHFWVRPLMRDIAVFRTGGRDERVPEPLWDLIRPDRPDPTDRSGPGLSVVELGLLVDELEQL